MGIQVWGSSALFTGGGTLPDGSMSATIVQGHNTVGINVIRLGELTMSGPHQIQNNGSSTAHPGIASISCDTTSLISGDLAGVAGINCMQIERRVGPPRPGRVFP